MIFLAYALIWADESAKIRIMLLLERREGACKGDLVAALHVGVVQHSS